MVPTTDTDTRPTYINPFLAKVAILNFQPLEVMSRYHSIIVLTQQTQNMCITIVQRQRWSNIAQMLYKCFVFAGYIVVCEEQNTTVMETNLLLITTRYI